MANAKVSDFDLKALLDLHQTEVALSINCHAIGTIQSFDSVTQTAKVSINYKKVDFGKAGDPPVFSDYPLALDCPVIILSGGLGGITFPIASGDTCLVLYNDRDIDNWFSSGQVLGPATPRLHSFSDAIALVGLRSLKNPVVSYSANKTTLFYTDTKVQLGTKVLIENAATDLKSVINGLIDLIAAATVSGTPLSNAAAITAYKTTVGTLLE